MKQMFFVAKKEMFLNFQEQVYLPLFLLLMRVPKDPLTANSPTSQLEQVFLKKRSHWEGTNESNTY